MTILKSTNIANLSYGELKKKYAEDHALCPKCKAKEHCTTLIGYVFDCSDPDSYKDLNVCVCSNCEDKHTVHERVKN